MKRSRKPQVQSVTAARTGRSDDISNRTRRYLISMGIRTACFVGAVLVHGPLRWILVVCALVLPYIAVVMANAGHESERGQGATAVLPDAGTALGPAGSGPRPDSTP